MKTRQWKRRLVLRALAVFGIAVAVFIVPTVWFKPWSIRHFYTRALLEILSDSPMLLSEAALLPHGLDWYSDELDDFSVDGRARRRARVERQITILGSYDRGALSADDQVSYDAMAWFLEDLRTRQQARLADDSPYIVNQLTGLHVAFPEFMTTKHRMDSVHDARDFISRVAKAGKAFDQVIATARDDARLGVVPPRFILQRVERDAAAFAAASVDDNALFTFFDAKVRGMAGVTAPEHVRLLNDLRTEIEGTLRPAYRRFVTAVAELESVAGNDAGIWKLPGGETMYRDALRAHITLDLSPEQVHALGASNVERVEGEMRGVLSSLGLPAGDLTATMAALRAEERFHYPDTPAGRSAVITDAQAVIDESGAKLNDSFDLRPSVSVKVEPVPAFMEKSAAGAFYVPSSDGVRQPGTFFMNLRNVREINKAALRTTTYHEAIPGHHFQIMIARQQKQLPLFRQLVPFDAYNEGWALYAESLAVELGLENDPYERLGYLTDELWRSLRLVVDTGLHARHWTRDEAITYLTQHPGREGDGLVAEVERYVVRPGNACSYMVGFLKIAELRARAKQKLGSRFDLRAFHRWLLTRGSLPLAVLESSFDRWLTEQ